MSQLHLTKVQRLQIDVMRQELTPWGLGSAIEMGGQHMRLKVWARDGSVHGLTVLCTPRDAGDAVNTARQRARRLVRSLNARMGY